jgi:hypothetical protein
MNGKRVIHASWTLLAVATVLTSVACSEPTAPSSTDGINAQIEAGLNSDIIICRPTEEYTDGLGGLNPRAYERRASRVMDCFPGPADEDPSPGSPGIWVQGWEPQYCFDNYWDPDEDGVHNGCENALAAAFAPELMLTTAECSWDYPLGRLGGEYYFAVQQAPDQWYGSLRLAYLPGYYWDCGVRHDDLSECRAQQIPLVTNFCEGHTGDTEFTLIDITYNVETSHWVVDSIFLSAHCGEITGNECKWYHDLSVFQWRGSHYGGAPVIWVSEKKHASYPTQDACNSGVTVGLPGIWLGFELEHCEYNNHAFDYPIVYGQQNVGSRVAPLRNCDVAFSGSSKVDPNAVECIWNHGRFNGWQGYSYNNGASSYSNQLATYAEF